MRCDICITSILIASLSSWLTFSLRDETRHVFIWLPRNKLSSHRDSYPTDRMSPHVCFLHVSWASSDIGSLAPRSFGKGGTYKPAIVRRHPWYEIPPGIYQWYACLLDTLMLLTHGLSFLRGVEIISPCVSFRDIWPVASGWTRLLIPSWFSPFDSRWVFNTLNKCDADAESPNK